MGPKKEVKKEAPKREKGTESEKKFTIDDPINSDSWRCVVVMAVERTQYDCFVLEEFRDNCNNGGRKQVCLIDFETDVMRILNGFANGELPYKYSFLLNFSTVFQEAVDYIEKKMEVPLLVLVKIIKAVLFYLREENLMLIKRMAAGSKDPIVAMAERPANFDFLNASKKKEVTKKGENEKGLKVRPPSVTKEETKLLKRGERAKDDHYIDDAPRNAYFNLYVLLTGFYNPDFPLELIKANIPLHGVLCIDTSLSGVKRDSYSEPNTFQKSYTEAKSEEIQTFWELFLKRIWDPKVSFYFKDTVFQVYTPQRLLCDKKKLGEFIYTEISFLMYDLSDLKRQLANYLEHVRLWEMTDKEVEMSDSTNSPVAWPEHISEECSSVAVVLRNIINTICEEEWKELQSASLDMGGSEESGSLRQYYSSNKFTYESCLAGISLSQELEKRGDINSMNVYYKMKDLDVMYDLVNQNVPPENFQNGFQTGNQTGGGQTQACLETSGDTLYSTGGTLRSYWNKYSEEVQTTAYEIDYCLYALLMTKVLCPYQTSVESSQTESYHSVNKNSTFEIKYLSSEARKPHFTVTEGSRSILKAVPYNVKNASRDFFCPDEFKIVTPEKLKASSAPEFRTTPGVKIQTLYMSEIFPYEISKKTFQKVRGFINECLFLNVNDFDFLEFLNKPKLLEKEREHWANYNCVDHSYSVVNDCIFVRLHNRKDSQDVNHETFNQTLKTSVGLRDFYEYVLEDEAAWLACQEELYQAQAFLSNMLIVRDSYRDFADSDFWMPNSLKFLAVEKTSGLFKKADEVKTEPSSADKVERGKVAVKQELDEFWQFEGYNVSDMAVQFSGLKTTYYSDECNVSVQLIERLYGNQDLGVHVTQASHSLHLYSYVCPEPHILDPFTFHVNYKNGIVVAFGRRYVQKMEEPEDSLESTTTIKSKKNASEVSAKTVKTKSSKSVKDEDFMYDMVLSLPNGLTVKTVRRIVKPCYIKQYYFPPNEEIAENSRLFLPNGDVIRMMSDGTVEILKMDSSIITANLSDLITGEENLSFSRYGITTGEGLAYVFEKGEIVSSKRYRVFQNIDMSTNQIYFRRNDGTDYMTQNDGTVCVQFKDGTKMSSSLLVEEFDPVNDFTSGEGETTPDEELFLDFVFVAREIITEHPDYATVIYNGQTENWRILLPYDSTIAIDNKGDYVVDIDTQTQLKVEGDLIRMNRISSESEPQCTFTANLSVFENSESTVYCHLADSSGKVFIVEGNSNCYILNESERNNGKNQQEEGTETQVGSKESELSEFIASADLQVCPTAPTHKNNKLLRENKYFALRRDLTGVEVLHRDDVAKTLTKTEKGSLVFTQDVPGTENRFFLLVSPVEKQTIKKWGVKSIIPNPKYEPGSGKATSSSTYGVPPSWMHPFPKQKVKFVIPQPLTCRIFLETKKTELSPAIGTLDCQYCEIDEVAEPKHSQIPEDGVEEYIQRLLNDDQDLLTEIYGLAAASLINEKKKLKPTNSEKLEHYLELSRYQVAMREYHERCIRYHIVPNYFHHPAGMSWLILNNVLLLKLPLSDSKTLRASLLRGAEDATVSESLSTFSNEEIEYNMSPKADQSFSSLSYRSDLSAQTAPPVLRTGGVCRCKVSGVKDVASSPVVKCVEKSLASSETNLDEPQVRICEFQGSDIDKFKRKEAPKERPFMSLEDLMYLGLI